MQHDSFYDDKNGRQKRAISSIHTSRGNLIQIGAHATHDMSPLTFRRLNYKFSNETECGNVKNSLVVGGWMEPRRIGCGATWRRSREEVDVGMEGRKEARRARRMHLRKVRVWPHMTWANTFHGNRHASRRYSRSISVVTHPLPYFPGRFVTIIINRQRMGENSSSCDDCSRGFQKKLWHAVVDFA